MSRVVMHVDLDAFYASVEQLRRPELRGKPVVVGGLGVPGERGVVAAASYEARAFGVRSAMPLSRARRLCPEATFVPCDFEAYRTASHTVFGIFHDYSPLVEGLSLDEAYLELTGSEALLGPPTQIANALRDRIKCETGLDASIGIGSCKVVAKVASDLRKPRGLVVVPSGEEAAFLAPLSLEKLPGCGPATIGKLGRLGIKTIGQLATLPEAVLSEMLGEYGRLLHEHARGIDPSTVQPPGEPKSISREVTFDQDLLDRPRVFETARALLHNVGQSLRRQGLAARTVVLKIRYRPFETRSHQTTLALPSDRDDELAHALDGLLTDHLDPARPVRLVGAGVSNLSPRATQLDLLEPRTAGRASLDSRLDALRERFGAHAVFRGTANARTQKDFRRDDIDAVSRRPG